MPANGNEIRHNPRLCRVENDSLQLPCMQAADRKSDLALRSILKLLHETNMSLRRGTQTVCSAGSPAFYMTRRVRCNCKSRAFAQKPWNLNISRQVLQTIGPPKENLSRQTRDVLRPCKCRCTMAVRKIRSSSCQGTARFLAPFRCFSAGPHSSDYSPGIKKGLR